VDCYVATFRRNVSPPSSGRNVNKQLQNHTALLVGGYEYIQNFGGGKLLGNGQLEDREGHGVITLRWILWK
jgi:hypothetical protein